VALISRLKKDKPLFSLMNRVTVASSFPFPFLVRMGGVIFRTFFPLSLHHQEVIFCFYGEVFVPFSFLPLGAGLSAFLLVIDCFFPLYP